MKKSIKILLSVISLLLLIIVLICSFLYFNSPKYLIKNREVKRVYIYHNELGREIYELSDEEKDKLISILNNADIGKSAIDEYEQLLGGPWFSFFCEIDNKKTVQVYSSGKYIHLNSVPFHVDTATADALLSLHNDIENKILPLDDALIDEIRSKTE